MPRASIRPPGRSAAHGTDRSTARCTARSSARSTARSSARSTALTCLLTVLFALLLPGTAGTAQAAEDCAPVPMGRYAGELTSAGQTACLTLPVPRGARIAALTSRGGVGVEVGVTAVDAEGTAQCGSHDLVTGGCALTGTAPYRLRVTADDPADTGAYGVHLVRTDELQADCPVLPAGTFADDTAAVRTETGGGVFSHCLTIPAGAHSAHELLRVRYGLPDDTEEFPDYGLYLIGTDGDGPDCYTHPTQQQLKTDTLVSCSLTAGTGYTVLVEGQDAPRTHTLNRRDVTSGAQGCTPAAATAIGAPARTASSEANGSLRCHRVTTAATTDQLRIDVRDGGDTTHLLVMDDAGAVKCHLRTSACAVTGSTGYQVVTQVPADWTLPASYRLDAWRIATAAGLAPECPRAGSVRAGFGPVTGGLDEQRTAACAVLPTSDGARLYGSVTATDGGVAAEGALFGKRRGTWCAVSPSQPCEPNGESLLLVSLPDGTDRTAYRTRLTCADPALGCEFHDPAHGWFKPVTPTRLMDTRSGLGVRQGKVGPGGVVTLQVTGRAGIPTTGVTAVVLNVTATAPTAGGFVSVYPDGTTRTSASNLNFTAGQTIPNLVVVPVVNGKVSFYNRAGSVDLLADVTGYYVSGEQSVSGPLGSTYEPLTPTRLMDTRSGLGVAQGKVGPGGVATLQVTGKGGIPAEDVTAVVLNVTATAPTSGSFVSVHPDGTTRTSASNLNFTAGQTIPNLVVVPVVNGKVNFYNRAGSVDLLADVAGYFTKRVTGATYKPLSPTRLMDTRSGLGVAQGKVGPGGTVTLPVEGIAGVPAAGVRAVVLNVTATAPTAGGFVSVHPDGTTRTSASNLNFTAGQTIPNLVVVPVVNGKVSFYNKAGSVDLLADVAGYYTS
ncbi:hypothetical protein ACFW6S_15045 [Streptomyces sp. NPDC058740]|uniref:hypothetical protein n=1 Tax=Streptomyces sp. NPDC058740 TaxID=3346619 RepID=UPI0036BF920A